MYDDLTPRRFALTEEAIGSGAIRRVSLMGSTAFADVTGQEVGRPYSDADMPLRRA